MENDTMILIDVPTLPKSGRHAHILTQFDALAPGSRIVIMSDHDPRPLYLQMLAERGNTFEWKYETNGPDEWHIEIVKREIIPGVETVASIAVSDYRKALVFKRYGIDFCCGGKKSVEQACHEKQISVDTLHAALQATALKDNEPFIQYDKMSPGELAEHIVKTHHAYIREVSPDLLFYADKVANKHGDIHPELTVVAQHVRALLQELHSHMAKEERILFPYIAHLSATEHPSTEFGPFNSVQRPIQMMEMEHDIAGNLLKEISTVTNQFTPPDDACNSYRILYDILQAFEDDLHLHIHLENNILFPAAIAIDERQKHS